MKQFLCYISLFLVLMACFSCKKSTFITDDNATLAISADTLRFDTVFTSVGSVSQYFTLVNTNSQKLRLSSISLMGGNNSAYRMIVDGTPAIQLHDLEINAGDSIYIFVSVTVDPDLSDLPFLVEDSIEVNYNGNQRYVQLQAYGQNAHFLYNPVITSDTIWTNSLPYVIFGGIRVAENSTLNIEKGCRIFLYADAPFIVDGTLKVNGTVSNPVVFQGSRLDEIYSDLPSSWPGIYFRQSSLNNTMQSGIIKNAYQGIVLVGPSSNALPKLQMQQCVIDNIYDAGILALGSDMDAVNCLISNCGSNMVINSGGNYTFTYCTIVSYDNKYISHKKPVLSLSNMDEAGVGYDLQALFRNCIIWAGGNNVTNEVSVERGTGAVFNTLFDHVLYKSNELATDIQVLNGIANQDPAFDSINVSRNYFDFHIGKNPSPAIGSGIEVPVSVDLDGRERSGGANLGCYTKP